MTARVTVLYFAQLRDWRGLAREELDTDSTTLGALYEELAARHGFGLPRARVRVAQNDVLTQWDESVSAGAVIVFLPPVSGG